jgi:hypothetical protein
MLGDICEWQNLIAYSDFSPRFTRIFFHSLPIAHSFVNNNTEMDMDVTDISSKFAPSCFDNKTNLNVQQSLLIHFSISSSLFVLFVCVCVSFIHWNCSNCNRCPFLAGDVLVVVVESHMNRKKGSSG